MQNKILGVTKRTRATPYSKRVEAAGVKAYTVYNRMLLPTMFRSNEEDYWHLCEHVQVWDVSVERQVEIVGPDASKLVQLMTPRDLSKTDLLQGKYAPICDAEGKILNDPIVIKLAEDRWWLSLADSDVKFYAQGLATGYGMDVQVFEPDVFPLAVQGPKAEELCARVFGEEVRSIRFFRGKMLPFQGVDIYVARSGWSHQGGFEIYLHKPELGEALWDAMFEHGEDLNVGPGSPHGVERLEAGLLSFGSDMDDTENIFECGLDRFFNLEADVESLSLPVLRELEGQNTKRLFGVLFDEPVDTESSLNVRGGYDVVVDGELIGEVRSQAWSYRYKKYMMFISFDLNYTAGNNTVEIDGKVGEIHYLPFDKEVLKA
ncbi:MAG: dimethylsulfoniopropionate demethylase [Pseudomonadota bacterium]